MVTDFILLKHSSGCLAVFKRQEIVQHATHYHQVNGFFFWHADSYSSFSILYI